MRAIGVPEIAGTAARHERHAREETVGAGSQATRNYAKRQYTWFRRQIDPDWPRYHA
jgi:tRNA dimethylallyltransferase